MQNTKVYYKQPPYFQQNIPIINKELIKNNAQMPSTPRMHSQSPPILHNQKQITFFPIEMTNYPKNQFQQIKKVTQNSFRPSIYHSPQGFPQKSISKIPMFQNSIASQKPESINRSGSLTKIGDQISRISYLNVNTDSAHSIMNRTPRGQVNTNTNTSKMNPIVILRPPSSLPQHSIDSKEIIKNIQQKAYLNSNQNSVNNQKLVNARTNQLNQKSHSPQSPGYNTYRQEAGIFVPSGSGQRPISNPKNIVKFTNNKIDLTAEPTNKIKNIQMRTSQVKVIYQRGSHSPNQQYNQLHTGSLQEAIPRPFSPKIQYVQGINPKIKIFPDPFDRKHVQGYQVSHSRGKQIGNKIVCTPAQSIAGEYPKNFHPQQLKQEKPHIIKNSGELALSSHIFSKPNQIQSNKSNSSSQKKRLNSSQKKQINRSNYEQSNKKESFSSDNNYFRQDPIKQIESRDDFSIQKKQGSKKIETPNREDMKETVKPEKIVEVHHSQIPNQVSVKYKTQTDREQKKSSKKSSSIKSNRSSQIPKLYGEDIENQDQADSQNADKQDSKITEKKSQKRSNLSGEQQKEVKKRDERGTKQEKSQEIKNRKIADQVYAQGQMENISTIKQQSQQYEHQFQYSNSLIASSMKREARTDDLKRKEENVVNNRSQSILGKLMEKENMLNKSGNVQNSSKQQNMELRKMEQLDGQRRNEIAYRNNSFQQSIKLPAIVTQPTQYTPHKINPFAMIQKRIEETEYNKDLNQNPKQQISRIQDGYRKQKSELNQISGIRNGHSYNWQSNYSYRPNNQDNEYENRLENQVISQNQKTKINYNHHTSQTHKNASILSEQVIPKMQASQDKQKQKQRFSAKNIPAEGNIEREYITNQYSHHTHHHHHLHNYYGKKVRSVENEEDQSENSQREISFDYNFYDLIDQIYNQQLQRGLNRIRDVFNKTLSNGHVR